MRLHSASRNMWVVLSGSALALLTGGIAMGATASVPAWSSPLFLQTGAHCHYLEVGDLNHDGRPDLVVPTRSSGQLHIFMNLGGGAFGTDTPISSVADVLSVAIADLDHDGNQDLLAVGFGSGILRTHFGTGSGTFLVGPDVPLGGKGHGVAVADLNGDGWDDVVVTTAEIPDHAIILWNNGSGVLVAGPTLATGVKPYYVTLADLDGDQDVDIVVSNQPSASVSIFRNDGLLGFVTLPTFSTQGVAPGRIEVADLDGDGLVELLIPHLSSPWISRFESAGAGLFVPLAGLQVPAGQGNPGIWLESGDLDLDGRPDLAYGALTTADQLGLVYQQQAGLFSAGASLPMGSNITSIRLVDLDGNGSLDICASAHNSDALVVVFNGIPDCNGNGTSDPLDITAGVSADCNLNGVPDECDLSSGSTMDCDANSQIDSCEITLDTGLDLDTNGTLDSCQAAGLGYCFGDGSGAACPCDPGQVGGLGRGCRNSGGQGGQLAGVGSTSVSADSVVLTVVGVPPTSMGIFFQGDLVQASGLGTPFGDGLLCANGNVVRMGVRQASGGVARFGYRIGSDPRVHVAGQVGQAGGARFYQFWYRDSVAFCTASTYNLTNGLRITWLP